MMKLPVNLLVIIIACAVFASWMLTRETDVLTPEQSIWVFLPIIVTLLIILVLYNRKKKEGRYDSK